MNFMRGIDRLRKVGYEITEERAEELFRLRVIDEWIGRGDGGDTKIQRGD